jgi:hypothetical protein
MKNLVILACLFFSINSFSQKIDSIKIFNQVQSPSIQLFGWYPHTGFSIVNINSQISDTIVLSVFLKECGGYTAITPFDTLINYNQSWSVSPSAVKIYSIIDTNSIQSNCFINNVLDTVEINTFSASALSVNNFSFKKKIIVYPNPAKDILQLEVSDGLQIERLELYDINGRRIRVYKKNELSLNVDRLISGTYFLKISTQEGEITKKVLIE